MLIWIEDKDETLISLEGMRALSLQERHYDKEGERCYSADHPNFVETVYDLIVTYCPTSDEYQDDARLARYNSLEAAKTYRRYLGMSIARASRDNETFVIVPHLSQENCDNMTAEFARWDAEDAAKRAVAKAAARTKQEDKGEYTPSI